MFSLAVKIFLTGVGLLQKIALSNSEKLLKENLQKLGAAVDAGAWQYAEIARAWLAASYKYPNSDFISYTLNSKNFPIADYFSYSNLLNRIILGCASVVDNVHLANNQRYMYYRNFFLENSVGKALISMPSPKDSRDSIKTAQFSNGASVGDYKAAQFDRFSDHSDTAKKVDFTKYLPFLFLYFLIR